MLRYSILMCAIIVKNAHPVWQPALFFTPVPNYRRNLSREQKALQPNPHCHNAISTDRPPSSLPMLPMFSQDRGIFHV
ncbi:hypothetical protein F5Y05DRAFT_380332 [Hypoxylon sp. FL0543]|nr:hypothetical protein F5Y05DRAFT_380332 [Hypoxylon sp. FL0543]